MAESKPRLKHPDIVQELLYRTWIRENCPSQYEGMVVEDLDLLIRWYGKQFRQDGKGRFMFVEIKHGSADLTGGQRHTWSLIDWLLSKADPERERYRGFFLIQSSNEDWEKPGCRFKLNKHPISLDDLHHFLLGADVGCPSYFTNGNVTPWKEK